MLPNRLRDEIAAWLEFYRELGIEEFLIEPREMAVPAGQSDGEQDELRRSVGLNGVSDLPHPTPPDTVTGPLPDNRRPDASRQPSPLPQPLSPDPRLPVPASGPARSLNLFETEAARRAERETLEEIRADLGDCQRCKLAGGRKTIVFGQGNPHAQVVFVGEGPGADEDEQGLPFVGRAGQLLNRMLQMVGIKREDVYICNVVKCRPPGNRTPERDEVEACSPFLYRQIEAIRPRLVCCLGAPAVKTVLGLKEGILKLRGRFYEFGNAKALATVHPAYVLRNPREEKILREDFEKIRDFLNPQSAPSR